MEEKTCAVKLENRKRLVLTGISEVVCFLEDHGELVSSCGVIVVTGVGLHMEKLDLEKGEVLVTGQIDSLYYPTGTETEKKSIFGKLFS